MEDAKRDALALAAAGYQPPAPRDGRTVGGPDTFATLALGHPSGRIAPAASARTSA